SQFNLPASVIITEQPGKQHKCDDPGGIVNGAASTLLGINMSCDNYPFSVFGAPYSDDVITLSGDPLRHRLKADGAARMRQEPNTFLLCHIDRGYVKVAIFDEREGIDTARQG